MTTRPPLKRPELACSLPKTVSFEAVPHYETPAGIARTAVPVREVDRSAS